MDTRGNHSSTHDNRADFRLESSIKDFSIEDLSIRDLSIKDHPLFSVVEEINISKNRLEVFPVCLLQLKALKKLNLACNSISWLPAQVWTKGSLIELNVSHNSISSLEDKSAGVTPFQECNRTRFRNISFSSEPATPAPVSTTEYDECSSSDTEDTKSSSHEGTEDRTFQPVLDWRHHIKLHPSLGASSGLQDPTAAGLCGLKDLDLSYNLLDALPSGLPCRVLHLEKLNLSGNRIRSFGAVHHYPPHLQVLDLSHNEIQSSDLSSSPASQTRLATRPASASRSASRTSRSNLCKEPFLAW